MKMIGQVLGQVESTFKEPFPPPGVLLFLTKRGIGRALQATPEETQSTGFNENPGITLYPEDPFRTGEITTKTPLLLLKPPKRLDTDILGTAIFFETLVEDKILPFIILIKDAKDELEEMIVVNEKVT
jgi:hypothetical protein